MRASALPTVMPPVDSSSFSLSSMRSASCCAPSPVVSFFTASTIIGLFRAVSSNPRLRYERSVGHCEYAVTALQTGVVVEPERLRKSTDEPG
jgi:hypothetical protein